MTSTATATCTLQTFDTYASPRSLPFSSPANFPQSARHSLHSTGSRDTTPSRHARPSSATNRRTLKRSLQSRDSAHMESLGELKDVHGETQGDTSTGTPSWAQGQAAWLKRLSTFSSDESSMSHSPRPASAAVSHSNKSIAFSNTGSAAPMISSYTPPSAPPNKLVKRTSSLSRSQSTSRLPIPTLRRPATSHQRDATLKEKKGFSSPIPTLNSPQPSNFSSTARWKNYFTPKISPDTTGSKTWRRHSTSIPNPIRRVNPDRKYHPVLISGDEDVTAAEPEVDESLADDVTASAVPNTLHRTPSTFKVTRRFFSSPLPARPITSSSSFTSTSVGPSFGDGSMSENPLGISRSSKDGKDDFTPLSSLDFSSGRSFSPIDSKPADLPKWKRPPKSRLPQTRTRRSGNRSVSGPEPIMGNRSSTIAGDQERPSKRRDIIGLTTGRNSLSKPRKSSDNLEDASRAPTNPLREVELNLSSTVGRTSTLHAFNPQSFVEEKPGHHESNEPSSEPRVRHSPTPDSERPSRQSAAFSEFASTYGESDSDFHLQDDMLDSPGDTLYDSVRTRATSASSGPRGPGIEKFFDETRIATADNSQTTHEGPFPRSPFLREMYERPRHSVIEEEESISTPVRSQHNGSAKASPETFRFGSSPPRAFISSSPPEFAHAFPRVDNEFDVEEESWTFGEEPEQPTSQLPLRNRFPYLNIAADRLSPFTKSTGSSSVTTTPSKAGIMAAHDKDARSSIFDWSEQQPLDKSPGNHSPPRPRTVHGKKDAEVRGSRSVGRRAPSAAHVRSQSVPVVPELDGKRSQVVTNKFGTWGVGSKGVTEDWNEDFDFEEIPPVPMLPDVVASDPIGITSRPGTSGGMVVPKSIREQQMNVLQNINLLRDWGMVIEELKLLRVRAAQLKVLADEPNVWIEVDAMIDLADQESNDTTLAPRNSPPSSPTFDYDAFDEPAQNSPTKDLNAMPSWPSFSVDDVFETPSPSPVRKDILTGSAQPSPRRPRKDSEAVARSVIEALQQKRNVSDPGPGGKPAKKVPFDTTTLKRIVPYVQEVRDKIKRAIREAEGIYSSPQPDRDNVEDPSFSRIFHSVPPESPSSRTRRRRSTAATDHVLSEDRGSRSPPDDLTSRFKMMTVVQ